MRKNQNSAVLERRRLIDQIQQNLPQVVWLAAAGGYGKTMLAERFIESQAASALCLSLSQVTDPDHFFSLLRLQALSIYGAEARQLPLLTLENGAETTGFVQHFATQLARLAPENALLFFDDLHALPSDAPLQGILCDLVDVMLDKGVGILMASRHEPAPAWICLRARGRLSYIDESQLALSPEEVTELMLGLELGSEVAAGSDAAPEIESLNGWAAGLMLLIEHLKRHGAQADKQLLQHSLDDWFRSEVFNSLDTSDQALLCQCAWPRRIPESLVREVSGDPSAVTRLQRLLYSHAFLRLEHDPELGRAYHLHDHFRDFLRRHGEQEVTLGDVATWKNHWGRTLWETGHWSEAAPLLIETRDFDVLAQGLREKAGELMQSGRAEELFHWLEALPEGLREHDPHLILWRGLCLTVHDTRLARQTMANAWEALAAREDFVHMAIAWGGIIDSIWLEWAHVSEYEPWVDALLDVENEMRAHLPTGLWLRVLRAMLTALGHSRPWDPQLERWQSEGMSALSAEAPDDERVMLASQLMYLNTWQFGRRADAAHVIHVMAQSPDVIKRASPLPQCLWRTFTSLWALLFEGDKEACRREAEIGRELIRRHGIGTWDNAVPPIHCAVSFLDEDMLDDWVCWFMRTDLKAHRPFYDTFQAHVLSAQAWLKGHTQEALDHAKRATQAMEKHGSIAISAGFGATHAALLSENGRYAEALREAARAHHIHNAFDSAFVDVMVYLSLARIPLHRGQPKRALPYLRRAFTSGARERLFFPLMIRDVELAEFCALALQGNLERDYCHWLIRTRKLLPPRATALRQGWPWPCRIHVLGRFEVEIAGVGTSRVSQRKARALLSHLILAGPEGLPLERLAADLWPDSPSEKAMNSLHVTSHRVRELLHDPAALLVDGAQVRLNRERVWLDAWELADLASQSDKLDTPRLEAAVDLYRGSLQLSDIDDTARAIQEETLNRAYHKLLLALANRLEMDKPQEALKHYRNGLRYLPLETDFWAGLLSCESALGNQRALELSYKQVQCIFQGDLDTEVPDSLHELYRSLA